MQVSEQALFETLQLVSDPVFVEICSDSGVRDISGIIREASTTVCTCEEPHVTSLVDLIKAVQRVITNQGD